MVHFLAGNKYVQGEIHPDGDRLIFNFPYNKDLIDEIKNLEGRKWDGEKRNWSAPISPRNLFTLSYLVKELENPYLLYRDTCLSCGVKECKCGNFVPDWPELPETRYPLWDHQKKMTREWLKRKRMIWAAEMRTGKTRAAVAALEYAQIPIVWWVTSKAGIIGVRKEFKLIKPEFVAEFFTYQGLVSHIKKFEGGLAPKAVVFDEAHAFKNWKSQRTQQAAHLTNSMITDHGDENIMVLAMTGTPNPKNPKDWWAMAEVVRPGYIKEANETLFMKRLALVVDNMSKTGGWYPELVTWWDDELKCKVCGQYEGHYLHSPLCTVKTEVLPPHKRAHGYTRSKNEIHGLYRRLKGFVTVVFKKDCGMDLPSEQTVFYSHEPYGDNEMVIDARLKPSQKVLMALDTIIKRAPSAAQALILARELSDGFQYAEVREGDIRCSACDDEGKAWTHNEEGEKIFEECWKCGGTKLVPKMVRVAKEIECPKDEILKDLLEEHEECKRLVVYGGFEGTIDRIVRVCTEEGWLVIRVDGRGWRYTGDPNLKDEVRMLELFETSEEKIVFVAQAESGSESISLSKSPTVFFYSNGWKWDKKNQAKARVHDTNSTFTGVRYIECFYLETDRLTYENLMEKKDLEAMTLGSLKSIMEER